MREDARAKFGEAVTGSRGLTCIDLGANVGEYTKEMAATAKCVIAFEPDPWAHEALRVNTVQLRNVKLERAAAGTRDARVVLYRHRRFGENPERHSQSSSLIPSKLNVLGNDSVEVQQLDFIRYLKQIDGDIGILKMDIEGAEVSILESLLERPNLLSRINYLFAETHESRIPGLNSRVGALRARAKGVRHPYINLYWH